MSTTIVEDADGVLIDELPNEESAASDEDHAPLPAVEHPLLAADLSGAAPRNEVPARTSSPNVASSADDELTVRIGDRQWRVRGLSKNTRLEACA